jgi:hypothetical protein
VSPRSTLSDSKNMQGTIPDTAKKINYIAVPDPFIPCEHKEILHWENRKQLSKQ